MAATVLVTWFIFDSMGLGLSELREAEIGAWRPDWLILATASGLLLVAYGVSAAIWGRIVVDLGGPALPTRDAIQLFMIANLGRYIPGKVWQIAGLAALAKSRGVPARTATEAAVMGQGIAIMAATGIGLGALLTAPVGWYRTAGMVTAAVMVLGAGLMAVPATFRWGAELWFRIARTEVPDTLGGAHGLRWLLLYTANWAMYALSFWLFVRSFEASAALVPVASGFAMAYVLGYIAVFAPAGGGIREGALVVFLTPHLGLGPAGGMAILARLWTTGVELVPAGIFWLRHVARPGQGGHHD